MKKYYPLLCSIILYTFVLIYLLLLLYMLIFQRVIFGGGQFDICPINLIPFRTIGEYFSNQRGFWHNFLNVNIIWNIIAFVPFGLYLPIVRGNRKIAVYLAWIFLFSLSAEIIQWFFRVGVADIDDITLNCLGGFLGLVAYRVLLLVLRKENRVRIFTTVISVLVGSPILYIVIADYFRFRSLV